MENIFQELVDSIGVSIDDGVVFFQSPFIRFFVIEYYDGITKCFLVTKNGNLLYARNVWWDDGQNSRVFELRKFDQTDSVHLIGTLDDMSSNHRFERNPVFIIDAERGDSTKVYEEEERTQIGYFVFCKNIDDSALTVHFAEFRGHNT